MKYLVTMSGVILLSILVLAGETAPKTDLNDLDRIPRGGDIDGYVLIASDILPFSPTIEVRFNLPETSKVDLFVTDTLQMDTGWVRRQQQLSPGLYRLSGTVIADFAERTRSSTVDVHLNAQSTYGSETGFPVDCSFTARRRMRAQ